MRRTACSLLLAVPLLLAPACSSSSDELSGNDALSYAGVATQGYELRTEITVKLPAKIAAMTGAEREAETVKHADHVRTNFGKAISEALEPSWLEIKLDRRPPIRVRRGSRRWEDLKMVDNETYTIVAVAEFITIRDLLSKLPVEKDGNGTYLRVKTKGVENAEILNDTVKTYITPAESTLDVYPNYMDLFDGGLDIALHVGSDWVSKDYPTKIDFPRARSVYDHLVAMGFKSSVPRFEDLRVDSSPLTKQIRVGARDVPVRVRIFHELMATPATIGSLLDAYKQSARSADVVIYDGHAGPDDNESLSFSFNAKSAGDLPLSTFKTLDMSKKQQIFFFNGCETYFTYADAVYANPQRNPGNTDILTAVGVVRVRPTATQVIGLIDGLLGGAAQNGPWTPKTWGQILATIGKDIDGEWEDVYGVYGIDDNSKANPLK